jgi:hypothetical protein
MIASTSPLRANAPDDGERQLIEFFRGEVPAPWPAAPMPVRPTVAFRHSSPLSGGRLALAASVAALLIGGWFLSGRMPSPAPGGSLDDTKATVPSNLRGGATPANPRH